VGTGLSWSLGPLQALWPALSTQGLPVGSAGLYLRREAGSCSGPELKSLPCTTHPPHPTAQGQCLAAECLWGDLREGTDISSTPAILSGCPESCGVRVLVPFGTRATLPWWLSRCKGLRLSWLCMEISYHMGNIPLCQQVSVSELDEPGQACWDSQLVE